MWRLLDYLQQDRLFSLYVVYLGCGLRRGEALALTRGDVDFETGLIYVRQTLQYLPGKGLVTGEPKSESSRRSVAMPRFVSQALQTHLAVDTGSAYVFCTSKGTPFSPRNIVRHFKRP